MEERRELPVGWVEAPIGNLCESIEQRVPDSDEKFFYIDISSVDRVKKVITLPTEMLGLDAPSRARKCVREGDVLVSMTRPNLNAVALVPPELDGHIATTGFDVLRSSELDCRWLFYLVRSGGFVDAMSDLVQGALYPAIKAKDIRAYQIPVAPLNEQRRIAAKLDTTLAAVDSCRQRLDGVEALLKRFRQAVLAAATSGELTREWREERELSDEWATTELGPLLNDMRYGTAKKCSYEAAGLPVLRIPNILESGCICQADLKYAEFDAQEVARLSLVPGDLLVIRSNGSLDLVGRVAEASEKDAGMLFAGYLIRLRPNQDKLLSPYLLLALKSPSTRNAIELAARSTSGVNNINSQFLSSLAIPLPAITEQQEIVRRTQELFSLADQLEARLTSARRIVERLTPALLAKAFRGELVPQDPGDEPASDLLARIRAARQAEAAGSSPSRRGRRKAAVHPVPSLLEAAPVPPDRLANLLRECGALSEKALLAASELEPARFQAQLAHERSLGAIHVSHEDGQELLEAVG